MNWKKDQSHPDLFWITSAASYAASTLITWNLSRNPKISNADDCRNWLRNGTRKAGRLTANVVIRARSKISMGDHAGSASLNGIIESGMVLERNNSCNSNQEADHGSSR
jgi:hypothetical protein